MRTIRTFIAIEMAPDVRQGLATLQEELVRNVPGRAVRWVEPDSIHLTLKFLGDTESGAVGQIGDRLEALAAANEPFQMRLGKLGCFPNPRRPRVIWVGVESDAVEGGGPLIRLQRAVEENLEELGWPAEKRRFHPHLTLGRVKESEQVVQARLPWGLQRVQGQQQATEICLIESDLRPTGAVYTVLRRATLAKRPAAGG
jgi:2'-5' RNA ligase